MWQIGGCTVKDCVFYKLKSIITISNIPKPTKTYRFGIILHFFVLIFSLIIIEGLQKPKVAFKLSLKILFFSWCWIFLLINFTKPDVLPVSSQNLFPESQNLPKFFIQLWVVKNRIKFNRSQPTGVFYRCQIHLDKNLEMVFNFSYTKL